MAEVRVSQAPPHMRPMVAALCLLLPFTQLVQFHLIGTLFLHDLLAPLILGGMLLARREALSLQPLYTFLVLIALWFAGQFVTDLVRGTPPSDYLRGWSMIVLMGINVVMLWLVSEGQLRPLALYLGATGIAYAAKPYVIPDRLISTDPWKFGVGVGVVLLVAVGSIFMPSRKGIIRYLPMALLLLIAGFSLWRTAAYKKYLFQATGDVSIFLGGRPESLVSLQAIWDSPILGHGSWAQDMHYVQLLFFKMQELGIGDNSFQVYVNNFGGLIPSHSHLLGAWVNAGVLGALFWVWVLWLALTSLYRAISIDTHARTLYTTVALLVLWDVMFSPFGAEARTIKAAQICILIAANYHVKRILSASSSKRKISYQR
ncbi:MAG: hypothetical protein P8Y48_17645 [Novosphingobium sp.]